MDHAIGGTTSNEDHINRYNDLKSEGKARRKKSLDDENLTHVVEISSKFKT